MNRNHRLASLLIMGIMASFTSFEANSKTKKGPDADELLSQAKEAFYNYDFEEVEDLLDQYGELKAKLKQEESQEAEDLRNRVEIASNAFGSVQQIVILDSISVNRNKFFEKYMLSPSTGRLVSLSEINIKDDLKGENPVYVNEDGDYILRSVKGRMGELELQESNRLLDGSWETREALEGDFEKSGNYSYPFMGGDGTTLYFANDGENSMGGYDIFVVQKEAITGECRQPLNLGMPFNSPYDDFMMVVDEENGVGWWATDRNDPGGNVTVYIYMLEDIRKNYPDDLENLQDYAKITDYKATWPEGKTKEISDMLKKIGNK